MKVYELTENQMLRLLSSLPEAMAVHFHMSAILSTVGFTLALCAGKQPSLVCKSIDDTLLGFLMRSHQVSIFL